MTWNVNIIDMAWQDMTWQVSPGHLELYKHRIFAINDSVREAYPTQLVRYELAKGIQDCNMLVVDGDWKKQFEYGPSSCLARVCGKSIIHLDSLKLNIEGPTDPKQLKVAHLFAGWRE